MQRPASVTDLSPRRRRNRHLGLLGLALAALLLSACAGMAPGPGPEVSGILAPTGKLRIGLYPGTPTSILPAPPGGETAGVGYELGRELAQRLGVAPEIVVFPKNADVLAALTSGAIDVAFTNASAARAKEMDFSDPYLEIELGYLVARNSTLANLSDIDRTGNRIGVTTGSTSDATLSRELKQASVVRAATVKEGAALLAAGKIDAFATNKPTLFEMADGLPGSRVLEQRWGVERHAIAIPKGRDSGLPFLRKFAADAQVEGLVRSAAARAGLRGIVSKPAR